MLFALVRVTVPAPTFKPPAPAPEIAPPKVWAVVLLKLTVLPMAMVLV